MENRFAGAQNQAERRRRRLANDEPAQALITPVSKSCVASNPQTSFLRRDVMRRVVSPRIWKHVLLLVTVVLVTGSTFWWASSTEISESKSVSTARLFDGLSGVLFLLGGQLAFLIGWLRSESEVDFRGSYRIWKWMAVAMCATGIVMITGTGTLIPLILSSIVETMTGPIQSARPAIAFATVATATVIILGRIIPEMSRCRLSQVLLVAGVLSIVVREMLMHSAPQGITLTTQIALTLAAANALFASMVLHCRFVAYICGDPPKQPLLEQCEVGAMEINTGPPSEAKSQKAASTVARKKRKPRQKAA